MKQVWIGVVSVLPQDGCELSAHKGAYVNFLTLARDKVEYRSKVASALAHYRLELHGLENAWLFALSDNPAEEPISIAEELQRDNNPEHVRFGTFHTFERAIQTRQTEALCSPRQVGFGEAQIRKVIDGRGDRI